MGHPEGILLRLLVADDDPDNLSLIRTALPEEFVDITSTSDSQEVIRLIESLHPHLVLLESEMASLGGTELLETIIETDPGINVILLARDYNSDAAVEAIKRGACDYLAKPISPVRLRDRIEQYLSFARLRHRSLELEKELLEAFQFEGMIGRSPLMLELFSKIRQIAPHFRTVLLTGETGTGKELVAKALHNLSPASSGPFVAYNCAAIVETLTESELFGYVKGAFTGATQDKIGAFEFANRGVLMLDEVGELPLQTQAKLLRVLQEQQVQRVGSPHERETRCPRRRGHQSRSSQDGRREDLSRGSLLSSLDDRNQDPCLESAQRGSIAARTPLPPLFRNTVWQADPRPDAAGTDVIEPPFVAGKRSRDGEHPGARLHHGRGGGDRRPRSS